MFSLDEILNLILHSNPVLAMSTRIIAVDGCGGAGKSTLAGHLSKLLNSCPIIQTDDFASAENPIDWYPRMLEQVLLPLKQNNPAVYQKCDWAQRSLTGWFTVDPQEFVIIEGVSSSRAEFRPFLSFSIFVKAERELRLKRGLERDGIEAKLQWLEWMRQEDIYILRDNPEKYADLVVDGGRIFPEVKLFPMDKKTVSAYSSHAFSYSEDWLSQPAPADTYELLKKFFLAGKETVDVGCGNGRDADWLSQNNFKVYAFDYSDELLKIASGLYPHVQFSKAVLPELKEIQIQFHNILCETVIMHLSKEQIIRAIDSLKRILKIDGVLYLSWRVTDKEDGRHSDGRLYTAFDSDFILQAFSKEDVLHFEDKISASSGKRVCRLIWKKPSV